MSNEALRCPFPHDQVVRPLPIVPLESGKRPEKKEKFGEYPPAIEFLGLLMVDLGVTSEENAKAVIDQYKSPVLRSWYFGIQNHKINTSRFPEFKLSKLLSFRSSFLTEYLVECCFGGYWDILKGESERNSFTMTREQIRVYVDVLTNTVFFLRKAVLNAALVISNQKLVPVSEALERKRLKIYSALRLSIMSKKQSLPDEIKDLVQDLPEDPFSIEKDKNFYYKIKSEIRSGLDQIADRKLSEVTLHPKKCQIFDGRVGDTFVALKGENGEDAYSSFRALQNFCDASGRVFNSPVDCPFTTAIPGIKEH